jgi:hypothetical protein
VNGFVSWVIKAEKRGPHSRWKKLGKNAKRRRRNSKMVMPPDVVVGLRDCIYFEVENWRCCVMGFCGVNRGMEMLVHRMCLVDLFSDRFASDLVNFCRGVHV